MAKRSLNQHFVFQIAMIISVVMTVIAVISVQLLGAVTTESLEHRVKVLAESQAVVLAGPLWDLDFKAVNRIVEALREDPDLAFAALRNRPEKLSPRSMEIYPERAPRDTTSKFIMSWRTSHWESLASNSATTESGRN